MKLVFGETREKNKGEKVPSTIRHCNNCNKFISKEYTLNAASPEAAEIHPELFCIDSRDLLNLA